MVKSKLGENYLVTEKGLDCTFRIALNEEESKLQEFSPVGLLYISLIGVGSIVQESHQIFLAYSPVVKTGALPLMSTCKL